MSRRRAETGGPVTPTTWSETIPAVAAGYYLWTRTIVNYSDGSSTTSYTVSRQGEDGATGNGVLAVYTRSATQPDTPTGTAYPPDGWYTNTDLIPVTPTISFYLSGASSPSTTVSVTQDVATSFALYSESGLRITDYSWSSPSSSVSVSTSADTFTISSALSTTITFTTDTASLTIYVTATAATVDPEPEPEPEDDFSVVFYYYNTTTGEWVNATSLSMTVGETVLGILRDQNGVLVDWVSFENNNSFITVQTNAYIIEITANSADSGTFTVSGSETSGGETKSIDIFVMVKEAEESVLDFFVSGATSPYPYVSTTVGEKVYFRLALNALDVTSYTWSSSSSSVTVDTSDNSITASAVVTDATITFTASGVSTTVYVTATAATVEPEPEDGELKVTLTNSSDAISEITVYAGSRKSINLNYNNYYLSVPFDDFSWSSSNSNVFIEGSGYTYYVSVAEGATATNATVTFTAYGVSTSINVIVLSAADIISADFISVPEWQEGETRVENVRIERVTGSWIAYYFPLVENSATEGTHILSITCDIKGASVPWFVTYFLRYIYIGSGIIGIQTSYIGYAWTTHEVVETGLLTDNSNYPGLGYLIRGDQYGAGTYNLLVLVTVENPSDDFTFGVIVQNDIADWLSLDMAGEISYVGDWSTSYAASAAQVYTGTPMTFSADTTSNAIALAETISNDSISVMSTSSTSTLSTERIWISFATTVDGIITSWSTPVLLEGADPESYFDQVAQIWGWDNYEAMEEAARSGETIFEGGYLKNTLINTGVLFAEYIWTGRLNVNDNFTVDALGNMVAKNADISGAITANNFDINLTYPSSTTVDPTAVGFIAGVAWTTYTIQTPSLAGTSIELYNLTLTRTAPPIFKFASSFYVAGSINEYSSSYSLVAESGTPSYAKAIWDGYFWIIVINNGFLIS